ncbi:MAG TPA: hypothetical protein VHI13_03350 [Candidatus Kapabacteria bacterium]|nr:hypothetical protein [Candidatus Kapabacteria bacterium]
MRHDSQRPVRNGIVRRHAAGRAVVLLVLCGVAASPLCALARGWQRYQSAHVVLLAPAGQDVTRLLDELERAHADVRAYGLTLRGMISARCYATTADFMSASGASAYNLALARSGRIHLQPLAVLMRRGELGRALRHEITHVALESAARRGLPRWLNEGMAMSVAGEKQPERLRFARLAQLEDTLARSRRYDNLRSAYGTAERLTSALLLACGRAKVVGLLQAVGAGSGFDAGFRALTGAEPDRWAASRLGR